MTFFYVDDQFYDHPKIKTIPRGGMRKGSVALWVNAGSWCARYLKDGQLPVDQVLDLGGSIKEAEWLRAALLWHGPSDYCDSPDCLESAVPQGFYQFHEWPVYQKTRQEVEQIRYAARLRQRASRSRRIQKEIETDSNVTSLADRKSQ